MNCKKCGYAFGIRCTCASDTELTKLKSDVARLTAERDEAVELLKAWEALWGFEPQAYKPDSWWNKLHKLRDKARAFLSKTTNG